MQLIGAYQILRFLADLALDGGQQLRRDRGIQNVAEHIGQLAVLLALSSEIKDTR